jgi:uncharacterized protein with HEPN domain
MPNQPRQTRGTPRGGRFIATEHADSDIQLSRTNARDTEALQDLQDFFDEAKSVVDRGEAAFNSDRILQLAGEAIITRIAEAASRMSDEYKVVHSDVPWHLVRGMRNIIVHDYHRTATSDVWATLQEDIPALRRQLGL